MLRPLLLALGLCCLAQAQTIVRAGRLLDVRSGQVRADQGLLVKDGRIEAAGPWAQVSARAPKGAALVDLSGAFVMPGLIDAHTHVLLQEDVTQAQYEDQLLHESTAYRALRAAAAARRALDWGFTAIRDLGTEGAGYADVDLKRAVEEGVVPGPRMAVAGRAFSASGTYPLQSTNWELALPVGVRTVDGADAIRRAVREEAARGADWIKVYVDRKAYLGPDGKLHGWLNFTAEELKAFTAEAKRLGKRSAAHAMGREGIEAALEAGFDSIEHGYGFDEALLERAAKQGTFWCPTLYTAEVVAPGRGGVWTRMPELARAALRTALAKGVRLANGSDAGAFAWTLNPAHELESLGKAGLPAARVLRMATLDAAELLGAEQDLGTLEPGRFADLVALDEDPLKDLSALQRIRFVMKGGAVVRDEAPRPR